MSICATASAASGLISRLRRTRARLAAACVGRGVRAFIHGLPRDSGVMDVGCGNNSPYKTKTQRPDLRYIGIDVGDYNQTAPMLADRYIVATPQGFAAEIEALEGSVEAVVSAHNIEHCDDPGRVLRAITAALKPGGRLHLTFPSQASIGFPHREGCLNFFDDSTHREVPDFDRIVRQLEANGRAIPFAARRYRPIALLLVGALLEPLSRRRGRTMTGTWALYGFEAVIWAVSNGRAASTTQQAN